MRKRAPCIFRNLSVPWAPQGPSLAQLALAVGVSYQQTALTVLPWWKSKDNKSPCPFFNAWSKYGRGQVGKFFWGSWTFFTKGFTQLMRSFDVTGGTHRSYWLLSHSCTPEEKCVILAARAHVDYLAAQAQQGHAVLWVRNDVVLEANLPWNYQLNSAARDRWDPMINCLIEGAKKLKIS